MESDELPQHDVVLIDEAQDVLNAAVFDCLNLVLAGGFAAGRWLIFQDSALQAAVYGKIEPAVADRLRSFKPVTFRLSDNFRNPKAIVEEACLLAACEMPTCRRTLQSPVEYRIYVDDRDQARKLRALLVDLIKEGIAPEEITILSPLKFENSCVGRAEPDVGKPIERLDRAGSDKIVGAITTSTMSGFKGLENDVILLTDLDECPVDERGRAIAYVGLTRARTKLYALVGPKFVEARAKL